MIKELNRLETEACLVRYFSVDFQNPYSNTVFLNISVDDLVGKFEGDGYYELGRADGCVTMINESREVISIKKIDCFYEIKA